MSPYFFIQNYGNHSDSAVTYYSILFHGIRSYTTFPPNRGFGFLFGSQALDMPSRQFICRLLPEPQNKVNIEAILMASRHP